MPEFTTDPLSIVIGATAFFGWIAALIGWRFLNGEFSRNGYVEQEPEIDVDLLEAELQMTFAPVKARAR